MKSFLDVAMALALIGFIAIIGVNTYKKGSFEKALTESFRLK